MTPAQALASYHRLMRRGQLVTLRRYEMVEGVRTAIDCSVKAVIQGYEPNQLIGPVQQGDRRCIILAEDIEQATVTPAEDAAPDAPAVAWPGPPRRNDKVVVRGRELNVEYVDGDTRSVEGVLMAYELRIKG